MAFNSVTYRVLIASPSDLPDDRQAATEAVHDWNALHSTAEGIMLQPVKWETHATPEAGVRPQSVINRDLVDPSDILIGMFWTKYGTSTGVAESGTVEEIDRFVKAGKPAMLYFSSRLVDANKIDMDQHQKLKAFKELTYKTALCGSYSDLSELKTKLHKDLTVTMRRLKTSATTQALTAQIDRQRAEEIRRKFEADVAAGKFRSFDHQRGLLALSIIPAKQHEPSLKFDRNFLMNYGDKLRPMRINLTDFDTDVHSIIALYRAVEDNRIEGITELTDRGFVFSADHWNLSNEHVGWPADVVPFYMNNYEGEMLTAIRRYLMQLQELGCQGPWCVGFSLLKAKGYLLRPNNRMLERQLKRPCPSDSVVPDLTEVPLNFDPDDEQAFASFFRHSLNQFWQGFGWPDDRFFNDAGRYNCPF